MNSRKIFRIGIIAVPVLLLIVFFPALKNLFSSSAPQTAKTATDSVVKAPPPDSTDFRHSEDSRKLFADCYRRMANAQKDGKLVRILHYGDSQIEADRVSGTFRSKVQEKFGGSGIGWFPVTEVSIARNNVQRNTTGSWSREELKTKKSSYTSFGFGGITNTYRGNQASIRLRPVSTSPAQQQKADQLRIYYSGGDASVSVKDNDKQIGSSSLAGPGFSSASFDLENGKYADLQLNFSGKSPSVFGLSLDGKSGVTVDNISLRGSSATEFTNMDTTLYRQQLQALQPGMIVLEFGLNVVPYITDDYTYYENQLIRQLGMIRRAAPEAAVLIVGVSDASKKKNGQYTTCSNLEKIRNAQRNAAEKTGCAFWDLRAVMGGTGSMETWHKNKLAEKDRMHFSNDGAALAGEKLADAFFRDFTRQTGMKVPGTTAKPAAQTVAVK